jgi:hypothetical protein
MKMQSQSDPTSVVKKSAQRRKLSVTATNLLSERDSRDLPRWVRAPARGVEFYSSVSRAKLYDLAAKVLIRSASLREPGQIKGTRLFDLQSVLGYIEQNALSPTLSSGDGRDLATPNL